MEEKKKVDSMNQGVEDSMDQGKVLFQPDEEIKKKSYPCIPLKGVNILPKTVLNFDVGRLKSLRALKEAMAGDKLIFVSSQIDEEIMIPTEKDLYKVGTIVKVKQMLKVQGDAVRLMVEGLTRATISEFISEDPYMDVAVEILEDPVVLESQMSLEDKAMVRILRETLEEYGKITGNITPDAIEKLFSEEDIHAILYRIAGRLLIDTKDKQKILEAQGFTDRLQSLTEIIKEENKIISLEKEISQKVKDSMDNNQKEYYLREKIKVIQEELGAEEDVIEEAAKWEDELMALKLSDDVTKKLQKEISRFRKMPPNTPENSVIRGYIETILSLPWHKSKGGTGVNLKKAEKILNEDHYGLEKVKERILEYLAVVHLSKSLKGPIICLVGPPGVGKTSIAKSIARALGRDFIRMSLGGVRDEAEVRGHRRTYVGAIPGRIISNIRDTGTNNPVFLFDEVDKIGADFRGDPASALLEVLDPEQNKTFTDHFLEIPFDLSKVLFITTANSIDTIPRPLLDRMEVIEVSGYTEEEKLKIAQMYLLPKQAKDHGLKKDEIKISEKAMRDLINYYTRESGVRNLQREIASLCRKVAKKVAIAKAKSRKTSYTVTPKSLEKYLGKHRFHYDVVEGENQVGVTTGLAWTAVGGDTLQIETLVLDGSGKIQLTGQLGDVMKESASAGISFVRAIADKYNIEKDFYKEKDIHIHVPEGAVPKDGPSAGVTMFTAMMSILTNTPVRRDLAMTGEITIRGKVLPVGGIKEKVLAAHRAGIKTVLLPKGNKADLDDIPANVKKQMEFHFLENGEQALEYAFVK